MEYRKMAWRVVLECLAGVLPVLVREGLRLVVERGHLSALAGAELQGAANTLSASLSSRASPELDAEPR